MRIKHQQTFSATLIAAVAVSAPAQAAPTDAAKPAFSFLGQDTETPTTMTDLMGKSCSQKGDEMTCESPGGGELGGVKLKYITMKYYRGKLYNIYGALWDHGMGDLLAAFSAKYGNPTAETRVWQNGRGARFDNATFIWKFRCGELELESLGWDLNTSSFQLTCPANQPPLPPPVVDF